MPSGFELAAVGKSGARQLFVWILGAIGYAFTLGVFYPGVMTLDARYVYNDIAKHFLGDWQSPVMVVLWSLIDPIAPGAASMFMLIVTLYWLAFALIGAKIAQRSWLGLVLPILAFAPPAFMLAGIIWRDVLFAALWLFATALAFFRDGGNLAARPARIVALVLVALGVLLRPNAAPAAPLLAVYVLWPARFAPKRAALLYAPMFLIFAAMVPSVYYGLLGAKRQNPFHQIFVFDLGGITHFTKENQFPVSWAPHENELLIERCYHPDKWDVYWYLEPCKFVMAKLEGEKIFGSSTLIESWRRAVVAHPGAYLQHRMAFTASFLTGTNLVMWTYDIENPTQLVFKDRPAFVWLVELHEELRSTWLFKPAMWLLLCTALVVFAWRVRETPHGAFTLGVCCSAIVYLATYFVVGIASDYRYGYWTVLAGLASSVVLLAGAIQRSKTALGAVSD